MKKFLVLSLCLVGLVLAGCDDVVQKSSDQKLASQQEQGAQEAVAQVGMPGITHFREKRMFKEIYEMRDQATVTYTYLYSPMTGKLIKLCDSIGFPLPNSTQYTNPNKIVYPYSVGYIMPQADPNQLYSPATSAGTWVMCKDPNSSDIKPIYSEPDLLTSPFPLSTN